MFDFEEAAQAQSTSRYLHAETASEEPDKGEEPALSGVAAHEFPSQHEVHIKRHTGHERSKENQDKSYGVE